jgi:hypothetical protein
MKVCKSVTHHISMGEYEWVELRAYVELNPEDHEGQNPEAVMATEITALLADDIKQARALTARDDSYIIEWKG